MTDNEVHVDVQHIPDLQTPAAQKEDKCLGKEGKCTGSLHHTPRGEDTLSLLADVALLPPRGDVSFSSDCEEVRALERNLHPMQLHLQFLLSEADSLSRRLINRPVNRNRTTAAEEVQRFVDACQPYFNHVEFTTRSTKSFYRHPSSDVYSKLLDFSQHLCDRLEQLVLTLASYNIVYLDEAIPESISHFCIGRSHLSQFMVTAFRYCTPTPYLSQVDTGLYKRMRWNVERLPDGAQQLQENAREGGNGEREEETVCDTEYYFLCCEEVPHLFNNGICVVKMWSIVLWVQVYPNPDNEDIFDWIRCVVPHASYRKLLYLGNEEPSSVRATDYLHKLLMSRFDIRAT